MEHALANFIRALRASEVRISTAETLDAFRTAKLVGWRNRTILKQALALTLPKTRAEKYAFDACFDTFFCSGINSAQEPGHSADLTPDLPPASTPGDADNSNPQPLVGSNQAGFHATGTAPQTHPIVDASADFASLRSGGMSGAHSSLGLLLMQNDRTEIAMQIARAARAVGTEEIRLFTQKGVYTRKIMDAMGNAELQAEIIELSRSKDMRDRLLDAELRKRRDTLRETIRDEVERQFLLYADVSGDRLREEILRTAKLAFVNPRDFHQLRRLVQKMAKKLVAARSRKSKVDQRGILHAPQTLRGNMRHDGNLIKLHWKSVKIDKPRVFAICDVSGSVANYTRFMLLFLYSLEEVLPKVRTFAFSSRLGEVTELFRRENLETAITHTLTKHAYGSTDYGQAFTDFERLAGRELDRRTTIIILGDARNNYGNPRTDLLRQFAKRSRRVIWLNPEPQHSWGSGDSVMPSYAAQAHQAQVCHSLIHLERVVSNLLRTTG